MSKAGKRAFLRRSTLVFTAPSLLFTAPSRTSTTLFRCGLASCCKHLEQLSECYAISRITFPPELVTPRSRNAFSEISEPREEVGACYERGSCQVAGPDNLSHYCRREASAYCGRDKGRFYEQRKSHRNHICTPAPLRYRHQVSQCQHWPPPHLRWRGSLASHSLLSR